MKTIELNGEKLENRNDSHEYLKELFDFPDYYGNNLDAFNDCLSEISEDTEIWISRYSLRLMCQPEAYGFRVFRTLYRAVLNNPHLKLKFYDEAGV